MSHEWSELIGACALRPHQHNPVAHPNGEQAMRCGCLCHLWPPPSVIRSDPAAMDSLARPDPVIRDARPAPDPLAVQLTRWILYVMFAVVMTLAGFLTAVLCIVLARAIL